MRERGTSWRPARLVVALTVLLCGAVAPWTPVGAAGFTVTGVVTDQTGAPLAGATVRSGPDMTPPQTTTGLDGSYTLVAPSAGSAEFVDVTPPVSRPELLGRNAPVVVTGTDTGTANVQLELAASITVTVSAGGAPANSWAYLYRTSGIPQRVGSSLVVSGSVTFPTA